MSLIDLILQVNISANSATPSIPGTDTIALVGYHTHNTDRIRTYFDPADMLTDGFSSTEALYLMAASLAQQNPRPAKFKVIRGTTSVAQRMTFKVTDTNVGDAVGFNIVNASGVVTPVFHTVTGGQTAAQIATALQGTSVTGATLTIDGGDNTQVDIAVTAAGVMWGWYGAFGGNITDTTASASPQNDLAAAALVDPDFYGVAGEWFDANNIAAIAAWTEANARLHVYTTGDSANLVASTGVFSTLKASAYNRSVGLFSGSPKGNGSTFGYSGIAWMSQRFTDDPGSDTWAYKTLAGPIVDALNATQIQAATPLLGATANNGNVYVPFGGLNATLEGVCASGLYADIQRGIDALSRDIQSRLYILLKTAKKIPYTRKGIGMVQGEIEAALAAFVTTGFLSNDVGFAPQVSVPDVSTVAPADKANRILRSVKFTCTAQGAIQAVIVSGTINF